MKKVLLLYFSGRFIEICLRLCGGGCTRDVKWPKRISFVLYLRKCFIHWKSKFQHFFQWKSYISLNKYLNFEKNAYSTECQQESWMKKFHSQVNCKLFWIRKFQPLFIKLHKKPSHFPQKSTLLRNNAQNTRISLMNGPTAPLNTQNFSFQSFSPAGRKRLVDDSRN